MTLINPSIQKETISISAKNIGLGIFPNGITESLMQLKYSFEGFNSVEANIFHGDLVVFENSDNPLNAYGCTLKKADTTNLNHANKNLMIFISLQNQTLILMHKGFLDFENTTSSSLGSWIEGNSLYANLNKIETTTPSAANSWVKSIGFCVPNLENKKRIWFESDSTFFTIGS